MKKQSSTPIPLFTLKSKINKINLNPEYQRKFIWGKKNRQLLIDTILRDGYVPEVLFRVSSDKNIDYEVIDGQQRIKTILEFMDDKLKIGKNTAINNMDISGLTYSQLPDELRNSFDSYALNYVAIEGTEDEITEMFRRLQAGVPTRKEEERNSIAGKIREQTKQLLEHPFWIKTVGVNDKNNNRMQFNEIVKQLILLEIYGVIDIKRKNIDSLYGEYNENGIPDNIIEKMTKVFDYLHKAFEQYQIKGLFRRVNIHGLYLLVSQYINEDTEGKNTELFAEWFSSFENNRRFQKTLPEEEREEVYRQYNHWTSSGTSDKDSLQARKDILYSSWKQFLKDRNI